MNCEEAHPLLALQALDALEAFDPATLRAFEDHLSRCERCAARVTELAQARAELDVDTLAPTALPKLDLEGWRAAERRRPQLPSRPRSLPRAAAAALLLAAATGAGALAARFTTPGAIAPPNVANSTEAAPAWSPSPESLAQAIVTLEERLAAAEQRHVQDLLTLARSIDRQQARRDHDIAVEFATLVRATGASLATTHDAVAQLAEQVAPLEANFMRPTTDER